MRPWGKGNTKKNKKQNKQDNIAKTKQRQVEPSSLLFVKMLCTSTGHFFTFWGEIGSCVLGEFSRLNQRNERDTPVTFFLLASQTTTEVFAFSVTKVRAQKW